MTASPFAAATLRRLRPETPRLVVAQVLDASEVVQIYNDGFFVATNYAELARLPPRARHASAPSRVAPAA